jgi:hypothetical protein
MDAADLMAVALLADPTRQQRPGREMSGHGGHLHSIAHDD